MWLFLHIFAVPLAFAVYGTVICSKRKRRPMLTTSRNPGKIGDPKPEAVQDASKQPKPADDNADSDIVDSVKTRKKMASPAKESPSKSAKDGSQSRKSETTSYSSQIVVVPFLADKWNNKNISVTVPDEQRKAKNTKTKKRVTFDTAVNPSKKLSKTDKITSKETTPSDPNESSTKSEKG